MEICQGIIDVGCTFNFHCVFKFSCPSLCISLITRPDSMCGFFWRLYSLMQMSLVKGSTRLCLIFVSKEIFLGLIQIHATVCMVWYVFLFSLVYFVEWIVLSLLLLISDRCLRKFVFLLYIRMLISSCWLWLRMKFIFRFLGRYAIFLEYFCFLRK